MNTNAKSKLEKEKKVLLAELSKLGVLNTETGDWEATPNLEELVNDEPDEIDRADRGEDFQERTSTLNTLEIRLKEVEKALENIENGIYGICEVCNEKIEEDRLAANPAAATCKEHMQ